MDENRARRVVDALRERGVPAHMAQPRAGVSQFGIRVVLPGDREALWDTDGTAGLEAQVMRDGMLVGFVPVIPGSEDFTEEQVIDAIARTDYDQPIATQRRAAPPRRRHCRARAACCAVSWKASASRTRDPVHRQNVTLAACVDGTSRRVIVTS